MNKPRIDIACLGFRGPPSRYFGQLPVMELPPLERTRLATFTRWRRQVPPNARFVPRVPEVVVTSGFRGEEAEAGWTRAQGIVRRLQAEQVLLRTPASFRPTAENRALLKGFFTPERLGDLRVAWWAEGLWESQPDARDEVADATGLIPVVDPLSLDEDEPLPAGARFYWRLMGRLGLTGRYSDHDLERLLMRAEGLEAGVIVFTMAQMRADALRLRGLVSRFTGWGAASDEEASEEDEDDAFRLDDEDDLDDEAGEDDEEGDDDEFDDDDDDDDEFDDDDDDDDDDGDDDDGNAPG